MPPGNLHESIAEILNILTTNNEASGAPRFTRRACDNCHDLPTEHTIDPEVNVVLRAEILLATRQHNVYRDDDDAVVHVLAGEGLLEDMLQVVPPSLPREQMQDDAGRGAGQAVDSEGPGCRSLYRLRGCGQILLWRGLQAWACDAMRR